MLELKNDHIGKNFTRNGKPQRSSWGTQKKKKKKRRRRRRRRRRRKKKKKKKKLALSPNHNILTPGRPVPALTQYHLTHDRVPMFKSLV